MTPSRRCFGLLIVAAAGATAAAAAGPSTQPGTAATTSSATQPALRVCTLAAAGVRFVVPADWTIAPQPLRGQLFSAHTPPLDGQGRFAVVSLQIDHAPAGDPDHAALGDLSDALAAYAFNHGGQHVTLKPDTLGPTDSPDALPARRVRFVTPTPAGAVGTMYVVAVKDGTEYLITVAGPSEIFDAAVPAVTPMLQSFGRLQ